MASVAIQNKTTLVHHKHTHPEQKKRPKFNLTFGF